MVYKTAKAKKRAQLTQRAVRLRLQIAAEQRGPALLLDLVEWMPPSLISRAIKLASALDDQKIRKRLLTALAVSSKAGSQSELKSRESARLTTNAVLGYRGFITQLSDTERLKLFTQLISSWEKPQAARLEHGPAKPEGGVYQHPSRPKAPDRTGKTSRLLRPQNLTHSVSGDDPGGYETRTRQRIRRLPSRWTSKSTASGDPGGSSGGLRRKSSRIAARKSSSKKSARLSSKKSRATKKKQGRIISTGFSAQAKATKPLTKNTPLKTGEHYYYWLEVGKRVRGSIEKVNVSLDTRSFEKQTVLKVVLFQFKDGLRIVPGQDAGQLIVNDNDSVSVHKQPSSTPPGVPSDSSVLTERLFFPVQAPDKAGSYRLRCNIYHKSVLLQSRIAVARVMERPQPVANALASTVDYKLVQTLRAGHLAKVPQHRLSLMLNSSNGSHDFFFFGDQKFPKDNVSFEGLELQDLISQARNAYALAAWGAPNPWDKQKYRYDQSRNQNLQQLEKDLIRFAIRGYNIYDKIINRLAGGAQAAEALADTMKHPGMIQIALKENPSFVLPAAIIYDYPLDIDSQKFALCPQFLAALNQPAPLEKSDCFQGNCPTRDDDTVICPSGHWGYRHELGMPLSIATAPDAPTEIFWKGAPEMTVGVSTDPQFVLRDKHLEKLRGIRAGLNWKLAATRADVIKMLQDNKPHVVYFYCHGGISETRPYLQVGPPGSAGNLSPSFLRVKKIRWDAPRPLIFINGCHTTALEPEKAIEFISPFIENANAAGVIGTEITNFEPLADDFAEEYLRRFLNGATVGAAVRGARLTLLQQANPLGLIYIPFALASLHLLENKN